MVTLVFWILAQAPYVLDREEYELRPTSQSRVSSSVCGERSAKRLAEWVAPVLPRVSDALAKTRGILARSNGRLLDGNDVVSGKFGWDFVRAR